MNGSPGRAARWPGSYSKGAASHPAKPQPFAGPAKFGTIENDRVPRQAFVTALEGDALGLHLQPMKKSALRRPEPSVSTCETLTQRSEPVLHATQPHDRPRAVAATA